MIPYAATLKTASPALTSSFWLLADGYFVPFWTSPDIVEVRNPLGIENETYIDEFGSGSQQLETVIFLEGTERGKIDMQWRRAATFADGEVSYLCVAWKTGSYEVAVHPDNCALRGYRVPVIFKRRRT